MHYPRPYKKRRTFTPGDVLAASALRRAYRDAMRRGDTAAADRITHKQSDLHFGEIE